MVVNIMNFALTITQVVTSEITQVLCFDKSKIVWTESYAILHQEYDKAYLLTQQKLKQTICGEIIKGVVLQRIDTSMVADMPISDEYISKVMEYQDNLWEMTEKYVAIKVDRREKMETIHKRSIQRNPDNPWKGRFHDESDA